MSTQTSSEKKLVGTGILAAIVASLCCITPVLGVLAGVGGIASSFSWLEPFRPYMIGLTVLVLGFAWYQKLKPKTEDIDCVCDEDEKEPFMHTKQFLGIVTVVAGLLLAFPHYSGIFFPESKATISVTGQEDKIVKAKLNIKGMTCTGCEHSVNYALKESQGVLEASSSYEEGSATIKFDQSKVGIEELTAAVEKATGYQVTKHEILNKN